MRLRTFTPLLNLVLRNSAVQTRNDNGIWDESRTLRRSDAFEKSVMLSGSD